MINPATPPPLPKIRRHRWLWFIPLVIFVPVFAALAWYVSVRVSNRSAVQKLEPRLGNGASR